MLDPAALSQLANLELRARSVVEGALAGLHRSPHHGSSVEFAEHKEYAAGDEIKHIDWKAYGKFDKYYVKRFEQETELRAHLIVDTSASMGYGVAGQTKLDYARILTACLTNLVHHQRDRVGFVAFDNEVVEHVPPSAKHMDTVLHVLDRIKPGRPGSLKEPLHRLAEHFGRRGVIVVISDFYEDPETVVDAITPLRFRGNDLIVFHVLDPAELEFGFSDAQAFEDLETGEQMPVVPASLRKEYISLVNAHVDALQQRFNEARVDYTLLDTSKPLDHALFRYLSGRARKMRTRQ